MKYYLVRYEDCWADELDIEGIFTASSEDLELMKTTVELYFKKHSYFNYGIGSNEQIEYDTEDELLTKYSMQEITKDEYDLLNKVGISGGFDPIESIEANICYDCEGEEDESFCIDCPFYKSIEDYDEEDYDEEDYDEEDEDDVISGSVFFYGV